MPYAQLMFENEKPRFMCQLIGKLSPIRLYIYGNDLGNVNLWGELMKTIGVPFSKASQSPML